MESQETTQKLTKQESSDDMGASIFAGAVLFLAGYGLYKLISNECEKRMALGGHTETNLLDRMINEEMK